MANMSKYKYAIMKELEWLNDEINILDKMLSTNNGHNGYLEVDLKAKRREAVKERERLRLWMKETT